MKKTFFYLVAFFLLCAFLSGCNASKASVAQVFEYDLGKGNILTESNQNIPYQMQGLIGVPDGENNPVVVILHGSHPIEKADKDRYDTGFSYLVEDLRQKGLLVLSINVGINYSFEAGEPIGNERTKQIVREHLDLLEEAVKGNNKLFSSDLSNKGDLNNIFLIGHSRAGLDVFEIANDTLPTRVSGIISVTPAFYKTLESKIPDIPTGIIISQYDGDVISLDGNDFYENILKSEKRSSDAELIYLKNANHGAFNTKLTQKDLSSTEEEIKKLMPAQNQRDFLTSYAADFIDQVLTKNSSVFSNEETLPTKVYGSDVLIRSTPGNSKMIISMDYPPNVKPQNAEIKQLIASFIPAKNTVDTFKMPGGSAFSEYGLLNILWQEKGAALTLPLNADLSSKKYLDFDLALDSTDSLNNNKNQSMVLRFKDSSGKSIDFEVGSDVPAMQWQEGKLTSYTDFDNNILYEYSTFTPLVTLRVSLNRLSGINLADLKEVEFLFKDTESGSIMLRSISQV